MSAPTDSVLYYPSIEFAGDVWVKASLLLWDRVYRIVPKGYSPNDSDAIRQAVDAGRVRDIHLEDEDRDEAYQKFQRFVDSRPSLPHGLASRHEVHVLHPDKVDERLYPKLENAAKHVFSDGRLELRPGLARGYMYFLSLATARRRNLFRGTDDPDSWTISSYFSENGNFGESLYRLDAESYYCSLVIKDLIPLEVSTASMSSVLEFSGKRSEEKEQLRESIHSVVASMTKCESADHREHIRNTHVKGLEKKKEQLRRSMHGFIPTGHLSAYLAVGLPATLTTLALGGNDPYSLMSLGRSVLVGAVAALAEIRRVVRSNRHPSLESYLLDLDEMCAKEKRIPYFQRSLEEFIND